MGILIFIRNQLLKIDWLSNLVTLLLNALKLDADSQVYESVHFFIYDTIKIAILLFVLVFIISLIQSYFSPEKSKTILMRFSGIGGNFAGAILGILTPFCSCSSIPIFIGFMSAGMPLGITFSFLITSPMVDLAAVMLLMSEIGSVWIALIYAVFGVLIGVFGGLLIGKMNMQDQIRPLDEHAQLWSEEKVSFLVRMKNAAVRALWILKGTWWAILIGVGIGAAVHGYLPAEWIASFSEKSRGFSPVLAALFGVPMYASTFGTIPVAAELYHKGMDLGTVLSFMMAVTALSVPSMIMLSRVIKKKLLTAFIIIVTVGIILSGYVFNWIAPWIR